MPLSIKNLFKEENDDITKGSEDEFYSVSESKAMEEANKSGNKMILLEPRAFSEAQAIVDHLKNRNSVVVNLKRVTTEQAKRIIDFLSGCIYAINGSMQKIGVGIYICAPKNVSVQGKITDDGVENTKSTKPKASRQDELDW